MPHTDVEVCFYGGDQGFVAGFAELPQSTGNRLSLTRPALASVDDFEWIVNVGMPSFGAAWVFTVWGSGWSMEGDRSMELSVLDAGFGILGGQDSLPVPGLEAGMRVWLRGRLVVDPVAQSYWYSYDETFDPDDVVWTPLGTEPGSTPSAGGIELTQTADVEIGGSVTANDDAYRLYAARETVNGVVQWTILNTDFPDDPAASFAAASGETWNVLRSAAEPNTSVAAAQAGQTYGMGHYGLCDRVNRPGCGRTRGAANPTTASVDRRFGECVPVRCGT